MDKVCLQCQQRLSFFKAVRGELFCSPDHRELYLQTESDLAFERVASFDDPVDEAPNPTEMREIQEPESTPVVEPAAEPPPAKVAPISKPRRPMPNWVVPGTAAFVSILILGVVLFGPSRKSAVQPLSAAERDAKTAFPASTPPPAPEPAPAIQPTAPVATPVVQVASVAPPKPITPIPAAIKPSQPLVQPAPRPTPAPSAVVAQGGARHTALIRAKQDSWVAVCSDGKEVLGRALANGDSREIDFSDKAVVRTGNAGGTEILVDGKPIGSIGPAGALRIVELAPPGFHLLSLKPGDNGHDCRS